MVDKKDVPVDINHNEPSIGKIKHWLEEIIIGLNFCPFAKKEFVNNTIDYHLVTASKLKQVASEVVGKCQYLHEHPEVETTLVILERGYESFYRYLEAVELAQIALEDNGFEGEFQLASMHPEYCFEGDDFDDAANYTNRSPVPLIHIIREKSMERVLSVYKKPEAIPENNMALAREKGSSFFENVLRSIHNNH